MLYIAAYIYVYLCARPVYILFLTVLIVHILYITTLLQPLDITAQHLFDILFYSILFYSIF